ncbi:MAG: hypothetical protein FWD47_13835, partial [Treponema sp.]|nr:hypothetical protein [Treponema sp.]
AGISGIETFLRLLKAKQVRRLEGVSVHGCTLSKKGGLERANRMFANGRRFRSAAKASAFRQPLMFYYL